MTNVAALCPIFMLPTLLMARQADTLRLVSLDEVVITNRVNHLSEIVKMDIGINPVNSSQEVLRTVPGLFIAQHAGGGKAEQMFLRGFDLDHGTDIAITVDGMPVNMTSHAHGQGYADLHFLQPETIEQIDFDKGPYEVAAGNLATAGYVSFKTKDRMPNELSLEVGAYNTQRLRTSYSFLNTEEQSMYISAALLQTDGYFDSPQNFKRLNLMGKYTRWSEQSRFNIILSHFSSTWNASGQIPWRAVRSGRIGRFGALDDTEGGTTGRTHLNLLHLLTLPDGVTVNSNAWLSYYRFNLYSNFTFFLNDPDFGDQINQQEHRLSAGTRTELLKPFTWGDTRWQVKGGVGFRYDRIDDLALYHTVGRRRIGTYALGDVGESNLFGYVGANVEWGRWTINPALRVDYFTFDYADRMQQTYRDPQVSRAVVSPKLSFIYTCSPELQLLLKMGKGFHSNDARVVVVREGKEVLPAAYGADLGVQWKPLPNLMLNAAGWFLQLQQEFVYVGDEAVIEPGGRTRRWGVDAGVRWEFMKRFYWQADYTYSHARTLGGDSGADYIPLAPVHTFVTSLNYRWKGINAGLRGRFLSNRPADETYALTARGYFVTDLNASYTYKRLTAGAVIENLFNTRWEEAQFATETRLVEEAAPVTEIHFTPGTPFNARLFLTLRF